MNENDIKDKTKYKRSRVVSGYRPHKLIRLAIHKYLKRKAKEEEELNEC